MVLLAGVCQSSVRATLSRFAAKGRPKQVNPLVKHESVTVSGAMEAVDRITASSGFVRSDGLGRFLRYVVERSLRGESGHLKETVIGVDVYGRPPAYDPKT